jgi:hypothetical protein
MDYKIELGLWVTCSIGLYVVGAWLDWLLRHAPSRSAQWLRRRMAEGIYGRGLIQLMRLMYYVGLPYVAVMRRVVSLVVIGVRGPESSDAVWWMLGWRMADWATALGWAGSLGIAVTVGLGLAWLNAAHAQDYKPMARGVYPPPPWWVTLRETLYCQIHWAFYRAGPLLVFEDAYWGVLVSATLPMLEWALTPDWWEQINAGPRREQVLLQCVWLALGTVYFILARNVWLAFALHLVLALGLNSWVAFLSRQDNTAKAPPQ